jgi:hypothetical protein
MSQRSATWVLWLLLVCTVPLPYFMIESGRVPALQLFVFAAVTAPLAFTDPGFTTRFIAVLFIVQSLLYGALTFLLARWVVRRVPHQRRDVLVAAVAVLLAIVALCDVYRAPLSHGPGATNLNGVFK